MSKKKIPKKVKCDKRYYVVREEFFNIMHDASQAYDKAIIGLSTAILGFMFGLLLYKHQILSNLAVMVLGCICLISAIGFSLYSQWLRQDFSVKGVTHLNEEYNKQREVSEPFNDPVIKKMEDAQKYSGVLFVLALICITIFVGCNMLCD